MTGRHAGPDGKKRATSKEKKTSPRLGKPGPHITVDLALYRRAWEIYKLRPYPNAIYEGIPEIGRTYAKQLVERGVPEIGLPPLSIKMQVAMSLATQMDVDEAAQSVAVGRKALRTALRAMLLRIDQVVSSPTELARLSPAACIALIPKSVELNEKLSKPTDELTMDALNQFNDGVTDVLGGLFASLRDIAAKRLPKTPDAAKMNATTPERLDKLEKTGALE